MLEDVMDEVFRQMWRDYKVLVKPALLMAATWIVFSFAYHFAFFNPLLQATGWPWRGIEDAERIQAAGTDLRLRFLPIFIAQLCAYLFFHLVLINSCRQARDKKPSLLEAIRIAARRWPRYLGAVALLAGIAIAVGNGLFFLANALSPLPTGPLLAKLQVMTIIHWTTLAVGIVIALYVGLRLNLFPFAIGLDKAGPLEGLRKSWQATRGQWWSMFMALIPLALLLGLTVVAVGAVVTLPLTLPAGLTPLVGLPTGDFSPGTYPLALSWNQGATLALVTTLFVFLFDVPFVYGHTVVWEITQEQYKPRPGRKIRMAPTGPVVRYERRKPAPPPPPMGQWKLPPSEPPKQSK